jgi:hypothetical protein
MSTSRPTRPAHPWYSLAVLRTLSCTFFAVLIAAVAACRFDGGGVSAPPASGDAAPSNPPLVDAPTTTTNPDATAPPDAGPPAGCPTGYVADPVTGTGYRYDHTHRDWYAAEDDCEHDGDGTHLAVITTDAELAVLAAQVGSTQIWVGVSDTVHEDEFRWVTGDDAGFLPWKAGEPNHAGPYGEDCVELADGAYNDESCTHTKEPYLCECDGVAADPRAYQ